MAGKPNWQRVKTHRSYTYEEAARALGLHKNTVMGWVRRGELPAVAEKRPHLILGRDLIAFLRRRREAARRKLRPHELYCLRCRDGRIPEGRLADLLLAEAGSGNLMGFCPACGAIMHKRVSLRMIEALRSLLDVAVRQASLTLRGDG